MVNDKERNTNTNTNTKTNSDLTKLENTLDKLNRYFETYFMRYGYEEGVRYLELYIKLITDLVIKTNNGDYGKFLDMLSEAFELVKQKDENDKDKESDKSKIANKTKNNNNNNNNNNENVKDDKGKYVSKYLEIFISELGGFFEEGVIVKSNGEIDDRYVSKLNNTIDSVKEKVTDLEDKRVLLQGYLNKVESLITDDTFYKGSDITEGFTVVLDLKDALRELDIKDELNEVLLEQDNLKPEEVVDIMHELSQDALRLTESFEKSNESQEEETTTDDTSEVGKEEYEFDTEGDIKTNEPVAVGLDEGVEADLGNLETKNTEEEKDEEELDILEVEDFGDDKGEEDDTIKTETKTKDTNTEEEFIYTVEDNENSEDSEDSFDEDIIEEDSDEEDSIDLGYDFELLDDDDNDKGEEDDDEDEFSLSDTIDEESIKERDKESNDKDLNSDKDKNDNEEDEEDTNTGTGTGIGKFLL